MALGWSGTANAFDAFGVLGRAAKLQPDELRCEYRLNPLGIDSPQPRLSWVLRSRERAQKQTAYQVLVAGSVGQIWANRGDLWDSGKVAADETAQIVYAGKPLTSGQGCFWKVRVWDRDGVASDWSAAAYWEMGLLAPDAWKASWIGRTTDTNYYPAPLLRRAFTVTNQEIARARVYISGLGYYALFLNGKPVGDQILDPGFTRYDRRVLYATHEVTSLLKPGKNAIGVMLGTGWFNCHTKAVWNFHEAPWRAAPKLILQLRMDYTDGHTETIVSDAQWRTATGPIVFDSIYGGETYDARLQKPGWTEADYNDGEWTPALEVKAPAGVLTAQPMPPIEITRRIEAVKVTEPKPGVFVFDFGQNLAGRAELDVKGPAGTRVVLQYGERLGKDGLLDLKDIAQHVVKKWPEQQFQTDTYLLQGKGSERWHSQFTYHGFQYVQVTGWPGTPKPKNLTALFNHTAVPAAGQFECSNPLLNRIQRAARWAYLSNLQSIPTDCPHREKNGWTGDAHLAAEQALFNFAPATLYTKWINDLADEQRPTGELPGIVPTSGWGYSWGNGPAWDSAYLLIPYYLYVYCGDTRILTSHLDGFRRYVDYLASKSKDDGIVDLGLNDWAPFETKTGAPITSTGYFYVDAQITSLAARLSGNEAEAKKYADLAASIRKAFNAKFYHAETGQYDQGSQTALSCALYQGLVDPANQARVVSNLVAAVESRNGHIDTGILGAKYLLNALLEYGRADVAYRVATRKDLPSWGWWLAQGATTLWEQWNGTESRNHIMFGDISAWFYKAIAGIQPDPAAPGFRRFIAAPQVLGDLTWAKATYHSIRGPIVSEWELKKGDFLWHLVVPANTTATVYLPIRSTDSPQESGKPLGAIRGIRFLPADRERTAFEIGSGDYHFRGKLNSRQ